MLILEWLPEQHPQLAPLPRRLLQHEVQQFALFRPALCHKRSAALLVEHHQFDGFAGGRKHPSRRHDLLPDLFLLLANFTGFLS